MRLSILSIFFLLLNSCGSPYDEQTIKNFQIAAIAGTESKYTEILKTLVSLFNDHTGFEALHWVDQQNDANSTIKVTAGLEQRDGKIGWGQWTKTVKREGASTLLTGQKPKITTIYSMDLEFDMDFINKRLTASDLFSQRELETLFFHEAGHGHGLSHVDNPQDVMYKDISGQKDFNGFFQEIRRFHDSR